MTDAPAKPYIKADLGPGRMNDDVPFDKTFDLEPGRVREIAPQVRAIVANNPGPFTFKGTMSYIVGRGKVAILDPGPDDDAHIGALLDAVRGETVTHIFVTHTHRDHSPAAPKVKAATGAKVFAQGPHRLARPLHIGETRRLDASRRHGFPSRHGARRRRDGQRRRLDARSGDDARPHRQPHGVRVQGSRSPVLRRPCHGVVDDDRGAARRRHERLHGLAA